jgi:serine/threonine-protein kinase HipA
MFNYLIGNADAHAKNLSVLIDERGFQLAPFYDLLCVRAYGDTGLALFIGDDETFDAVGAHSWEALSKDCGFNASQLLVEFRRMAVALLPAWDKLHESLAKKRGVTKAELQLLTRMTEIFKKHCANAVSMTER